MKRTPPKRLRRRPVPTVDDAVELALSGVGDVRGTTSLVLCTRIGHAAYVPPGYQTADCSRCGSACWINPDIIHASERRGMTVAVLCEGCVDNQLL